MSNIIHSMLLKMEGPGLHEIDVRNQEAHHMIHNAVQIRKTNFRPIWHSDRVVSGLVIFMGPR